VVEGADRVAEAVWLVVGLRLDDPDLGVDVVLPVVWPDPPDLFGVDVAPAEALARDWRARLRTASCLATSSCAVSVASKALEH
jgi:hypothetical protein